MKRGTPRHPKTNRLARRLDIQVPHAVGILEMLWHYAGEFTPQGDIGKHTDEDIAQGVLWHGNAQQLISALTAEHWLDVNTRHRLIVHDWPDHAEESVKKKLLRAKQWFLSVYPRRPSPPDGVETASRHSRDGVAPRAGKARQGLARLGKALVVTSATEKNLTPRAAAPEVAVVAESESTLPVPAKGEVWDKIEQKKFLKAVGWSGINTATEEQVSAIMALKIDNLLEDNSLDSLYMLNYRLWWFDEFWTEYWNKANKKQARTTFFKVVTDYTLHEIILKAVIAQTPHMSRRPRDKVPHASTWLNGARWEDPIMEQSGESESLWAN